MWEMNRQQVWREVREQHTKSSLTATRSGLSLVVRSGFCACGRGASGHGYGLMAMCTVEKDYHRHAIGTAVRYKTIYCCTHLH